jgi:hypothetical protein
VPGLNGRLCASPSAPTRNGYSSGHFPGRDGLANLILRGAFSFLGSLGLFHDLVGQALRHGEQPLRARLLAVHIDIAGQPDRKHGLENSLGTETVLDELDSRLLPMAAELVANLGKVFNHDDALSNPDRIVLPS